MGADLLASRLQGQDVLRSGFYDVVRDRLGWSPAKRKWPSPAISRRVWSEDTPAGHESTRRSPLAQACRMSRRRNSERCDAPYSKINPSPIR